MAKNSIELHLSKDDKDVAYVSLPNHPGKGTHGVSKKQIRLKHIYPNYQGADLVFDFDNTNCLIGIEILV